jgi:hypothetical protein
VLLSARLHVVEEQLFVLLGAQARDAEPERLLRDSAENQASADENQLE